MERIAGLAIRHFRSKAGLTLKALGKETGISYNTINAWEHDPGRLNPSKPSHAQAVDKIARSLKVDADDIWNFRPLERNAVEVRLERFLFEIGLDKNQSEAVRNEARALLAATISQAQPKHLLAVVDIDFQLNPKRHQQSPKAEIEDVTGPTPVKGSIS